MPQQLSDMKVEEVSLVDDPANPGAQVLLWKRKQGGNMSKKLDAKKTSETLHKTLAILQKFGLYSPPEKAMGFSDLDNAREKQEMIAALGDSLNSIAGDATIDDTQKAQLMQQSVQEFISAVGNPGMGMGAEADKSGNQDPAAMMDEMDKAVDLSQLSQEQKEALLQQLLDEKKKAAEASTASPAGNATEGGDAMEKEKVDEMVNKALEPVQKQLKEAQDTIAKMNEDKALEQRIVKAKEITKGLTGVDHTKVAEMLKGLSSEAQDTLGTVLKAASEQARLASLLVVKGSDLGASGEAHTLAKSKAEDIKKSNPKLSDAQALAKVWEQNPALYEQYCREQH